MACPARIPAHVYEEQSRTLSCAASTNFSRVDSGGSCVCALTAAKLGTSQNIRLVCWPWESSFLFWGAGAWSGNETVPLSVGGAGDGLLCDVGLCWAYSRGLDWSVTCVWDQVMVGEKRMTRTKTAFMISSNAFLRIRCKGGLTPSLPTHNAPSTHMGLRLLAEHDWLLNRFLYLPTQYARAYL